MSYRERREAKAARLREWAEKRETRAEATLQAADSQMSDLAYATQPGHIPGRERVLTGMERAWESKAKAEKMRERADGIEAAADRAIYSDDPDAVEALTARIAELEARRARIKAINGEIRRGKGWAKRLTPALTDDERQDLLKAAQFSDGIGYPTYALTNLSGNIRRQRDRLILLTTGQMPTPKRGPAAELLAYEAAQAAQAAKEER